MGKNEVIFVAPVRLSLLKSSLQDNYVGVNWCKTFLEFPSLHFSRVFN